MPLRARWYRQNQVALGRDVFAPIYAQFVEAFTLPIYPQIWGTTNLLQNPVSHGLDQRGVPPGSNRSVKRPFIRGLSTTAGEQDTNSPLARYGGTNLKGIAAGSNQSAQQLPWDCVDCYPVAECEIRNGAF